MRRRGGITTANIILIYDNINIDIIKYDNNNNIVIVLSSYVSVGRGWGPRASVIYDCGGDPRSEASGTVQRTDSEDRTHSETRQLPTRLETCARCACVCVCVCARARPIVCVCARVCVCVLAYPYNVTAAGRPIRTPNGRRSDLAVPRVPPPPSSEAVAAATTTTHE